MTGTALRPHGTNAGYNRHKWRGEEPCSDCLEAQRVRNREYYAAHRERRIRQAKSSQLKHREERLTYFREYNSSRRSRRPADDPVKQREVERRWRAKYPEKRRIRNQRRRAIQQGLFVEDVDVSVLAERDGWVCGICMESVPQGQAWVKGGDHSNYPTVDHVEPLSLGGVHSYANTQLAHLSCNSRKRNKTV